jgi:hypothetical protein
MTAVRDAQDEKTRDRAREATQLALIDRLASRFPELSREQIAASVRGEYEGYATSPIQDFVPILVERSVSAELKQQAPRYRA